MRMLNAACFNRRGGILFAIIGFIVVLLPFILTVTVTREIDRRNTRRLHQEARLDVAAIVRRMAARADPVSHFSELSERLVRTLRRQSSPIPLLRGYPAKAIEIMCFDRTGRRLPIPGLPTEKQAMSEKTLALILRRQTKEPGALSKTDERLLDTMIGNHLAANLMAQQPNKLHNLFLFGTRRLSGLFSFNSPRGQDAYVLVQIQLDALPRSFYADTTLRFLNSLPLPDFRFGAVDLEQPADTFSSFERELIADRLSPVFAVGRFLVGTVNLPSGIKLYASRRKPLPAVPMQPARLAAGALTGLFFLVYLRLLLLPAWFRHITLTMRLMGLFSLIGLCSAVTLLSFAQSYRQVRESSMLRQVKESAARDLLTLDETYSKALRQRDAIYRSLISRIEKGEDPQQVLTPVMQPFIDRSEVQAVFLVNASGTLLYRLLNHRNQDVTTRWAFGKDTNVRFVGANVIRMVNGHPRIPEIDALLGNDLELKLLLEEFIYHLWRTVGSIEQITLTGKKAMVYNQVCRDSQGRITALLLVAHEARALEQAFLSEMARSESAIGKGRKSLGIPKGFALPRECIPILRRYEPDIWRIHDILNQTGTPDSLTGTFGNTAVLLTGVPGKSFTHFHLYTFDRLRPIQKKLDEFTRQFRLFSLLLFVCGAFLGWLFSRSLIDPIHELAQGLQHLSRSEFDHKVSIESRDEFEQIGHGVNMILGDMKDLALAHTIQDQLLPGRPLLCASGSIKAWSRSTSEVGNELHDYVSVSDRHMLFLCAAVTGHGISAALMMAMIKMAFRLFVAVSTTSGSDISPESMVRHLQSYVDRHLHPSQPFAWCSGLIDASSGTATLYQTGGYLAWYRCVQDNTTVCSLSEQQEHRLEHLKYLVVTSPALTQAVRSYNTTLISDLVSQLADRRLAADDFGTVLYKQTPFTTLAVDRTESQTVVLFSRGGEIP